MTVAYLSPAHDDAGYLLPDQRSALRAGVLSGIALVFVAMLPAGSASRALVGVPAGRLRGNCQGFLDSWTHQRGRAGASAEVGGASISDEKKSGDCASE